MGEKAAMACTEAVEDVIEKHYAAQAEDLDGRRAGTGAATIRKFREDELGHKTYGARTPALPRRLAISSPFRGSDSGSGCRAAIKIAAKGISFSAISLISFCSKGLRSFKLI